MADGNYWGWGAVAVDTPPKDWRCADCGRRATKRRGRHRYLFGPERCTDCARAWHDEHKEEPCD